MKFPIMMRSIASPDLIVHFKDTTHGIVVSDDGRYTAGYESKAWDKAENKDVWEPIKDEPTKDIEETANNGGTTDYYALDPKWTSHQDVIEAHEMTYAQGNIYKVACTFNTARHGATNELREINKIIWFANRIREEILNKNKGKA